ncbi:ATP-binding protein, partial [Bacillus mycoides]|uniref:ATP-binding protein n=1 Tax=Bacillus mycoides TaxID=1405 RepID=UPI003D1B81C5
PACTKQVHLQETFLNIIKNAIEAMEKQGAILIKLYNAPKKVYIDFIDTGKGIEKDKVFLVLNPFYSTKKNTKGNYGLGLSYCYNVMQKHNGDIVIKSKINQGTTITLSLPSKRVLEIQQSNTNNKLERIHYEQN